MLTHPPYCIPQKNNHIELHSFISLHPLTFTIVHNIYFQSYFIPYIPFLPPQQKQESNVLILINTEYIKQ